MILFDWYGFRPGPSKFDGSWICPWGFRPCIIMTSISSRLDSLGLMGWLGWISWWVCCSISIIWIVCPTNKALEEFWNSVSNTTWFKQHPCLGGDPVTWCVYWCVYWRHTKFCMSDKIIIIQNQDRDLSKIIPLVIHGDDADSHRRRSFTVTTMGSVTVNKTNLWDCKVLLYCFDTSRGTDLTAATLDMWVCWSLWECQMGVFFDKDPWDRDFAQHSKGRSGNICGPYKAILALHKGDEKYLQKAYRTSHTSVSQNVCMVCRATSVSGPLLYTLHGPQAEHRNTLLDGPSFITDVCGIQTWVMLPGWSTEVLGHDWLHICDLTLIPEAAASCLLELAEENMFGSDGTLDEKLRRAHVMFAKSCRHHRIRTLIEFLESAHDMFFFCCWVVNGISVWFLWT